MMPADRKVQKALDRWARDFGHNDFDTYIRTGGSIAEAADDIRKGIRLLEAALAAIPDALLARPKGQCLPNALGARMTPQPTAVIGEQDEGASTENAHAQGAEEPPPATVSLDA